MESFQKSIRASVPEYNFKSINDEAARNKGTRDVSEKKKHHDQFICSLSFFLINTI